MRYFKIALLTALLLPLSVFARSHHGHKAHHGHGHRSHSVDHTSTARRATTTATFYAQRFSGRRMANGGTYSPQRLTAAHRRYRLGSRLRVVNRNTGRSVVVTVTDRCNCTLDLSPAAFRKIGSFGQGRLAVAVQVDG